MDNGYVKIPIGHYDALKQLIVDLKAEKKNLEMRLNLQTTPGIQVGTIQPYKKPYFETVNTKNPFLD